MRATNNKQCSLLLVEMKLDRLLLVQDMPDPFYFPGKSYIIYTVKACQKLDNISRYPKSNTLLEMYIVLCAAPIFV